VTDCSICTTALSCQPLVGRRREVPWRWSILWRISHFRV